MRREHRTAGFRGDVQILVNGVKVLGENEHRPKGELKLIDLGNSYFKDKLENIEVYNHVSKGGSWFICGRFFTICKWTQNFRLLEASFHLVAVWIRLLELFIELRYNNINEDWQKSKGFIAG
ncbi:hypothetical protein Godav_002271 [Gossypium davidsonii]|uniref:DUF4283 domain-containing protein n=1 Tax=Gossypium davidsonii TaxID=34287 RepID=A0A7J8SVL7_GOSDV|nr:hypothetical protein [Gossypium davidsonii]